MKNFLAEFKAFAFKGNLIPLAVGLLMAIAFAPVVQAFIDGIIMQIISAIFGKPDFDDVVIGIGDADLLVGTVITALIAFLMVALVCFFLLKAYDRINKKDEEAAGPSEVDLLTEIRDSLRAR